MTKTTNKRFTVRNIAQLAAFELELCGQISDGCWENVPGDHWQNWCDAEVVVGENVGRNFYAQRSYNFARKDLLDVVGQRMLWIVKIALALGIDVAREVHDAYIIDIVSPNDGNVCRFDWEPTGEGDYWDKKRAKIAKLDREAISLAVANPTFTMTDLRRELRDLSVIAKTEVR